MPPADVTVSLQLGYEAGKPPSVERLLGTVRGHVGLQALHRSDSAGSRRTAQRRNGEPDPPETGHERVESRNRLLGTQDDRDLGVMVDRVAVR